MTKIGDGKDWPKEEGIQQYHRDIDQSTNKFISALEVYHGSTATGNEKEHLKMIMDQQLEIIRTAVGELKRAGIYKQEVKVENDYKNYMSNGTDKNFSVLEQDIQTLREYNELP